MSMEVFEQMKEFVGFTTKDAENLAALQPVFAIHGPPIVEGFHRTLRQFPATAEIIRGREESLLAAHNRWMNELFSGHYGLPYFESRKRIGVKHVAINLPPYFVEGVMSEIRSRGFEGILAETADCHRAATLYESLVKILDLDLLVINCAYRDERIERIFNITGVSRRLIDNLVEQGVEKTA